MAKGKTNGVKRCYRLILGHTFLEMMISALIMLVITEVILQAWFINTKMAKHNDSYMNAISNSQYLYWLFHHHIVDNHGIENMDLILGKNLSLMTSVNELCLQKLISKNLGNLERVSIYPGKLFSTLKELKRINLKNISHKVSHDSDVLVIKTSSLQSKNDEQLTNADQPCHNARYNESFTIYFVSHSKLYQLSNSRTEELIDGVISMRIKKFTKLTHEYYKFEILYNGHHHPVMFALKALRLQFSKQVTAGAL